MDVFNDIFGCIQQMTAKGALQSLYYTMQCTSVSDLSPVVLAALRTINNNYLDIYHGFKKSKNSSESNKHRTEGNEAFSVGAFKTALECYNKALLFAKKNSQEKVLAYSNRSAVLLKINAIPACLKDIAICLSLNCTEEITKKLFIREEECKKKLWLETLKNNFLKNSFTMDYFRIKSKHPSISSISSDIEIDFAIETKPKIVASKDIKVGTVVAIEKSFVSQTNDENMYTACYFCQNMSFNLIPCDRCCYALFCSDECKKQCNNEYHEIECLYELNIFEISDLDFIIMIKALLKMKYLCKSWEVFNKRTQFFNTDVRNPQNKDIFDINNCMSVINNDTNAEFVYGKIFNASLKCAYVIRELCKIPFFFPTNAEARKTTLRSFARVMMHLIVFPSRIVQLYNSAEDVQHGTITTSPERNFALLSFTSKLRHSCDGNLLVLGVNNNAALVAMENIKAGTELTISYIGQWHDAIVENKPIALYRYLRTVCSCRICSEKWVREDTKKGILNDNQRTCYRKWKISRTKENIIGTDEKLFRQTCSTLNVLRDVINTEEYHDVYAVFRSSLSLYQVLATGNVII